MFMPVNCGRIYVMGRDEVGGLMTRASGSNLCFTRSEYRGRGAGRMPTMWGLKRADELGLGAYVDVTDAERPLYAQCAFEDVGEHRFNPRKMEPGKEWREMELLLLPFPWCGVLRRRNDRLAEQHREMLRL